MALHHLSAVLILMLPIISACDAAVKLDSTSLLQTKDSAELPANQRVMFPLPASLLEPVTPIALFEHVIDRAHGLAQESYIASDLVLPSALAHLDYDQYRSIRFRSEAALWRDETLFELQLFHLGALYQTPVRINLVHNQKVATMPFDKNLFHYDGRSVFVSDLVTPELGYAGFRVHYPLNSTAIKDEVVVFLGASYFRLLGRGHVYGLSSRGLAVDIGMERDEEFPDFREFWLVQPAPEATEMTFFALLDSPSVVGAYRFDLAPGTHTTLSVDARLYARRDVAKLGVAPMSSMFLYGQNRMPTVDDFRPQVHDSDGLLVQTESDEWIWRPLSNWPGVQVTSLTDHAPRGFGLLQRDRRFDSYLDLEANYHLRPSEWVAFDDGDWGSGRVELQTFHTLSEFTDNVAVYWTSDQPFMAGDKRQYRYRLFTFNSQLKTQSIALVERTRIGWGALPGQLDPPPRSHRQFVVDFSSGDVPATEITQPVEAVLEASTGEFFDLNVLSLPDNQGWRAAFRFVPEASQPANMRLYLEVAGRRLSETWSYVWHPAYVQ